MAVAPPLVGTLGAQNANSVNITGGTAALTSVSGSGSGLTGLNAGNVASGVLGPTYGGTGTNNGSSAVVIGGSVTFSGAYTFTATLTANTSLTFPTGGTLVTSAVTSLSSLAGVGTIGTGTWQATVIGPTYGGTGVNNGSKTITLGASLTTTGSGAPTLAFTGSSYTYTFQASSDTMVGRATTDTLTNKTFDTAGTGNVLKINGTQVSAVTGTGSVVLATSPTLTTPTLGVATVTTVNGLAFALTGSGATLNVASGKTLYVYNTLKLYGTDGSSLIIGSGGTLVASAFTDTTDASNITSGTLPAAQLPLATTSAFGAVKPDGSTITISGGVISAVGGGGGGGGGSAAGSAGEIQYSNGSGSFEADAVTTDGDGNYAGFVTVGMASGTSTLGAYADGTSTINIAPPLSATNTVNIGSVASGDVNGGTINIGCYSGASTFAPEVYIGTCSSSTGTPSVAIGYCNSGAASGATITIGDTNYNSTHGGTLVLCGRNDKLTFFGGTLVAQQSGGSLLADATGGSASTTLEFSTFSPNTVSGTGDDTDINANFNALIGCLASLVSCISSLAQQVNALTSLVKAYNLGS